MRGIEASVKLQLGNFNLEAQFLLPSTGVTAISGRSGAGKTTLLRWIAGLQRAQSARLIVNNQIWENSSDGIYIPTHRRAIGFIFQESSLFPHLNIEKNLKFGLKKSLFKKMDEKIQSEEFFENIIQTLGVTTFLKRSVFELSGGERQRVAIARSLLMQPSLLLFDEPLAALDDESKLSILTYLKKMKDTLKVPMLYVSHSENELIELADRYIVLENGKTELRFI